MVCCISTQKAALLLGVSHPLDENIVSLATFHSIPVTITDVSCGAQAIPVMLFLILLQRCIFSGYPGSPSSYVQVVALT